MKTGRQYNIDVVGMILAGIGAVLFIVAFAVEAAKLQIKVGHVEAGLRSYDRTMPEEINQSANKSSEIIYQPTAPTTIFVDIKVNKKSLDVLL